MNRHEDVARVVHEAVRAWASSRGDASIPPWNKAPQSMRDSTAAAIAFRLENPDAPPSAQHDQWAAQKRADGWKRGKVKDAQKKTHPMLVPYARLSVFERRKDALVAAVIAALAGPIE
jgi:hypothetical protein